MMLLIGMNINFTKNPTNPITTKPIAVRVATLVNSVPQTIKLKKYTYTENDKT